MTLNNVLNVIKQLAYGWTDTTCGCSNINAGRQYMLNFWRHWPPRSLQYNRSRPFKVIGEPLSSIENIEIALYYVVPNVQQFTGLSHQYLTTTLVWFPSV